jgi:hypothetical protein
MGEIVVEIDSWNMKSRKNEAVQAVCVLGGFASRAIDALALQLIRDTTPHSSALQVIGIKVAMRAIIHFPEEKAKVRYLLRRREP